MDPAEEILLDPMFVNQCFNSVNKATLVPTALVKVSDVGAPSDGELNAYERDGRG